MLLLLSTPKTPALGRQQRSSVRLLAPSLVGSGHRDYPPAATRTAGMHAARTDRALAFPRPTEQPFRRSGPFGGRIPGTTQSAARAKCPRYERRRRSRVRFYLRVPVLEDVLSSRRAISWLCAGRIDVTLGDKLNGYDAEAQVGWRGSGLLGEEIKLASIPGERVCPQIWRHRLNRRLPIRAASINEFGAAHVICGAPE